MIAGRMKLEVAHNIDKYSLKSPVQCPNLGQATLFGPGTNYPAGTPVVVLGSRFFAKELDWGPPDGIGDCFYPWVRGPGEPLPDGWWPGLGLRDDRSINKLTGISI